MSTIRKIVHWLKKLEEQEISMSIGNYFRTPVNLSISRWLPTGTIPSIYPPTKITHRTPNQFPGSSMGPNHWQWDPVFSFVGKFRERVPFSLTINRKTINKLGLENGFDTLPTNIRDSSIQKKPWNHFCNWTINPKTEYLWRAGSETRPGGEASCWISKYLKKELI